jgi:hypothetical protein
MKRSYFSSNPYQPPNGIRKFVHENLGRDIRNRKYLKNPNILKPLERRAINH